MITWKFSQFKNSLEKIDFKGWNPDQLEQIHVSWKFQSYNGLDDEKKTKRFNIIDKYESAFAEKKKK